MKNIMQYKGYYGSIEIDNEDLIFYGKLEFIRALVSYEGESAKEIREAFENAVDDYLQTCVAENLIPEKPFKGSFNIRIGEELHEKATLVALDQNMKLNEFVKTAIDHEVERFQRKKSSTQFSEESKEINYNHEHRNHY